MEGAYAWINMVRSCCLPAQIWVKGTGVQGQVWTRALSTSTSPKPAWPDRCFAAHRGAHSVMVHKWCTSVTLSWCTSVPQI